MTDPREEAENARQPDEAIYTDSHDWQRHRSSMQAIAEEIQRPVDEIAELYEEVLKQLREHARIADYLPVLVTKKVKQIYRQH